MVAKFTARHSYFQFGDTVMKKFLLTLSALVIGTVAASAADLPARTYTKAPPPPPPPPFSWTGIYIGANIGGALV